MNLIKDIAYYSMREYLKTFDFSNIQQCVIDRKNNKTFDNMDSYLKFHNKPIKPCYYHPGLGPNGIYGFTFLDYFDNQREQNVERFYFAGSSATAIYSVLLNCKKNIQFKSWLNTEYPDIDLTLSELFDFFINSYFNNFGFTIDDYNSDEIFINILCYDIQNNDFKMIFFTNFIDMKDMIDCLLSSCFIPTVTNKKTYMYYDKYLILDSGFIDNIFNVKYNFLNENINENSFLKELFNENKYPIDPHYISKYILFNNDKNIPQCIDFKKYHLKSLYNIKNNVNNDDNNDDNNALLI